MPRTVTKATFLRAARKDAANAAILAFTAAMRDNLTLAGEDDLARNLDRPQSGELLGQLMAGLRDVAREGDPREIEWKAAAATMQRLLADCGFFED